ncbi:ABC transporter ATP-binding protein [Agromyces aerolatus]|uniref:ABC transporter ATP-binding protein n=1 Tax=Agromyces sp. LY-1074 TaxID=3074080 RepID=UPI00285F29C3|nr:MULTISPECIES: ABC transporter ATP-binding protein [unclassified Agromyces]MDR5699433.1 ABC transporter ATP-binding protein [Agromyces sp. LY-1074]MDR5705729.1 ABC transporter ATP-binding protein [Agromyces sp. LY-1358]
MSGLSISALSAGYGQIQVLRDVGLECGAGEISAVLGRNGAGKTTLLAAIAGLIASSGDVSFDGAPLSGPAYARARSGIALVQEGKRIFRARTVEENLRIGGYVHRRRRGFIAAGIDAAYERFPILGEKRNLPAGLLSGGQQQMLAIAQALMLDPRVLLLDEPSAGLAPAIVQEVFGEIARLRDEGLCVVLVEQLVDNSLSIADTVAVLDHGRVVLDSRVADVKDWSIFREIYLGEGATA